jgi:hypothetical protein
LSSKGEKPATLQHLIDEVKKRKAASTGGQDRDKADELFASLFPAQQAFVRDPSKRKVAHCPRRAGKSHCILIYGVIISLLRPSSSTLICARTRGQAKGIYWRLLKRLCEEYSIDAQFKNMDLECHLPNGSVIYFSGADTSEEVDKYRGRSFDLVVIDEGKSYSKHLLDDFVYDVILRTLADTRGTLVIIGTPGTVEDGLFWSLINRHSEYKRSGAEQTMKLHVHKFEAGIKPSVYHWSLHHWTGKDNVKMPHIWDDACQEIADNQLSWDDPYVMREILGLPVADPSNLVFLYRKITDGRCDWVKDREGPHGLPSGHDWRYILSIDLGWHDGTGFVVAAWSTTHKQLHAVHTEKQPYMTTNDVMKRVAELEIKFGGFSARIVDPAAGGKRLAEDLSQVHGLYFESAKKSDRNAFIALLNADISSGKVAIEREGELAREMLVLQWGNREKTEVDAGCADDLCDAFLYAWRFAQHHWSQEKKLGPADGTPEWHQARLRAEREQLQKERAAQMKRDLCGKFQGKLNQLPMSARRYPGYEH